MSKNKKIKFGKEFLSYVEEISYADSRSANAHLLAAQQARFIFSCLIVSDDPELNKYGAVPKRDESMTVKSVLSRLISMLFEADEDDISQVLENSTEYWVKDGEVGGARAHIWMTDTSETRIMVSLVDTSN